MRQRGKLDGIVNIDINNNKCGNIIECHTCYMLALILSTLNSVFHLILAATL